MGVLILYPTAPDYKPTDAQVDALVEVLRNQQIIGKPWSTENLTWDHGPGWDRLGIPSYSNPMTLSVHRTEPQTDSTFTPDDWEYTLMQQHFSIHIQDAGHFDYVDRSDPIWSQMEQAIGSPLSMLYYHI